MKHTLSSVIGSLLLLVSCHSTNHSSTPLSLAGEWQVELSSSAEGRKVGNITLPATLTDAGFGIPLALKPEMTKEVFRNLKANYSYVGEARYTRHIDIPEEWLNQRVVLNLERALWSTRVRVNGVAVDGIDESLSTPHRHDISGLLREGDNTIEVTVDNSHLHDISYELMAHAYTNETQTIWNGLLGDISLTATPRHQYIEHLQLRPDVDKSNVSLTLTTHGKERDKAIVSITSPDGKNLPESEVNIIDSKASATIDIADAQLWDEFTPNLYTVSVSLPSTGESVTRHFGMRQIERRGKEMLINGHQLFLRGTLECCIFPLTGYPPTDVASWRKEFATVREHGLNHLRFHSWCPPEAAFVAADEMGLYLQIELPLWSNKVGNNQSTLRFLEHEAERIIDTYGHHPSFCFMAMGNELEGDYQWIDSLMTSLQQADPTKLYTASAFTFQKGHTGQPEQESDFWVTQWTDDGWVRGQGVFDSEPPSFDHDYRTAITRIDKPLVTHEIGQYSVFPNLDETKKYTGNLQPLNFRAVEADMKAKNLLHLAPEYVQATGHLATLLYKEDIERALKTPGISGYQLLGLQDFPGQSTALVGLVDAFWESKGVTTADEWRQFSGPVVPLARFAQATYWNSDTLRFTLETANYSPQPITSSTTCWQLVHTDGSIYAEGKSQPTTLPVGNSGNIHSVGLPLAGIKQAEQLTLKSWIEGTEYKNQWNVWVYPESNISDATAKSQSVVYTRSFDEAERALNEGRRVLLNPTIDDLNGLEGKFVQVFWSPIHFPNQAGTMGILCDPAHKALAHFPTANHSDWQWWDLCKRAKAMELDSIVSHSVKELKKAIETKSIYE